MANDTNKELLIKLLGLEATASDEAIANAATTFQNDMVSFRNDLEEKLSNAESRAATAEQAAKDAMEAADKIANEAKTMAEELVNHDLEKYKDVVVNADAIKEQLLNNRAATVALLNNIKPAATVKTPPAAPLHNPKTAGTPDAVIKNDGTTDVSREQAKKISNRASELARTLGISHQQAWIKASGEVAKETK
jgi:hypothetical protein